MKSGFKKVRLHVNPFRSQYQLSLNLSENWIKELFSIPSNSFIIDIGCAEGIWPIKYAQLNLNKNIIGLDIRPKIINIANENKINQQVNNVSFLSTNANVNLGQIIKDIEKISNVELITIQFPDPYFKNRFRKRRLVNKEFIQSILTNIRIGTKIFIQTDYQDIMIDIVKMFQLFPQFTPSIGYNINTLDSNINPFQIQTDRERGYVMKGLPIYRMLYEKTSELPIEPSLENSISSNYSISS